MEGKEQKAAIGDVGRGSKEGGKEGGGGSQTESLVLRSQVEPFEKIFRMFPVFRNNSEEVKSGRSHDL